jgi:hypothetical protein
MNHRTSVWEAPNSTASCGWATFKPVTDATTAISATHTAISTVRRRRAS